MYASTRRVSAQRRVPLRVRVVHFAHPLEEYVAHLVVYISLPLGDACTLEARPRRGRSVPQSQIRVRFGERRGVATLRGHRGAAPFPYVGPHVAHWRLPRVQFHTDNPKREPVDPFIVISARRLGRRVDWRAHAERVRSSDDDGHARPKIAHADAKTIVHQNVGRLNVPMHDAVCMEMRDSGGELVAQRGVASVRTFWGARESTERGRRLLADGASRHWTT